MTMTSSDESASSLIAELSRARIPIENHEFIRRFTAAIGVVTYRAVEASEPYVQAERRDGGPDLRIYWGYTTGFLTEEEVVRVAGPGVERQPSSRKGTWYLAHPTNQVRARGERARDVRRKAVKCQCGMELSLTGVCASCD